MRRSPRELVRREATLEDLDALPEGWRGEIIEGTLYAFPRPRPPHAHVESAMVADLHNPYHRGRGGPGGWFILVEPGIQLPAAREFSPDLAGWRRERLPVLPKDKPIDLAPDWICEILSNRTRSYDQVTKRRFYAKIGVRHLWYVEPLARTVTVSRLEEGRWLELGSYDVDDKVIRAEPFDAIEIELAPWFEGIEEPGDDEP